MGILADLVLKLRHVLDDGVAVPDRATINFIGGTVADNPVEGRIDVTIGGGVASLGVTAPILNTGTSSDPVVAISAATTVALGSMKCAGDLGGTGALPSVLALRGAVVGSAGGALTVGRCLRVTGAATCDWGALDLADSDAVTGVLPAGNVEATATPTASKIPKWDGSIGLGGSYLWQNAFTGTLATAGWLRVGTTASTLLVGHSASGTANRTLMGWSSAALHVGSGADDLDLDALTSAYLGVAGSQSIKVVAAGVQFFGDGATELGSGVGVLGLAHATTEPTTNPAAGFADVWAYGGTLKMRGPKGLVYGAAVDSDATQTLQSDLPIWWTGQTTDVAALVKTYAPTLPTASQFVMEIHVCGIQQGTDVRTHYKIIASGGRAAGALVVDVTDVQTLIDAIGVSGVPTVTNSANAPRLSILGKAATVIDWTVFGRVMVWSPTPP